MAGLHRGHAGLFKMREVAISYFSWPHMNLQIQLTAANCKECIKSGKNLKWRLRNRIQWRNQIKKFK